jgi:hypothetical protein
MDDFRVGGMPTPLLGAGFIPEEMPRTTGSASTHRAEMSGGLSNAVMIDHVGGNDPAGPNIDDWLDTPGPGQEFDPTAVMIALHQAAVAFRTAMHEAQQVDRDFQVATMKSEAQDIRNSAGFSFAAAVVTGAFQIAGGALDIGGAFHAYKTVFPDAKPAMASEDTGPAKTGQGTGPKELDSGSESETDTQNEQRKTEDIREQEADTLKKEISSEKNEAAKSSGKPEGKTAKPSLEDAMRKEKDLQLRMKKAEFISQGYSGLSRAAQGIGQIISGGLEFGSHQQDAAEKEHEADATKAASQVDNQADLLKNIDDLISGVRQVFSQMIEAKNETMNKITQA